MIGRTYPGGVPTEKRCFKIHFYDEKGSLFYRVATSFTPGEAVAIAMDDDRKAGGGKIYFHHSEDA